MSENTEITTEEVVDQPAENTAEATEQTQVETVFLVMKMPNGTYQASTDITKPLAAARYATLNDIKEGCNEVYSTIVIGQTARATAALLKSLENK